MGGGMKTTTTWDYSCDLGAVHRRAEKVCDEVVGLIGPDESGVTVEVEGRVCGEIKDSLKNRKIPFGTASTTTTTTTTTTAATGAVTALAGSVAVKRNGTIVGRVTAGVVVVPARVVMNAVDLGVSVLWADMNLDVHKFNDGERIPEASAATWMAREYEYTKPLWCHYDDDKASCAKWGKMYYMPDIKALERLCPYGWRIPTYEEWWELIEACGVELDAGGDPINDSEKARAAWQMLQDGSFRGVLGGFRSDDSAYKDAGLASFWPTRRATDVLPNGFSFGYQPVKFFKEEDTDYAEFNFVSTAPSKTPGFYVRCVRDK